MTALYERLSRFLGRHRQTTDGAVRLSGDEDSPIDRRKQELADKQQAVSRRKALTYGAGAVGATAGGWGLYTLFLERRSPDETVRQYYEALDEGDVETAEDLIHEDSPVQEIPEPVPTLYEQNDLEIREIETIEKGDGEARVRIVVAGLSSERDQQEVTVDLRTEGREWKLWLEQ